MSSAPTPPPFVPQPAPPKPESGPFDVVPAEPLPEWVGTPQQFGWLELIVRAIIVLNVADAVLTIAWVSAGEATEANPVMAELAERFPLSFVAVKMSLVSLGTLLLWRHRARPLAVVATFVAFLVYYFLLLYHLKAMNLRLVERLVAHWFG